MIGWASFWLLTIDSIYLIFPLQYFQKTFLEMSNSKLILTFLLSTCNIFRFWIVSLACIQICNSYHVQCFPPNGGNHGFPTILIYGENTVLQHWWNINQESCIMYYWCTPLPLIFILRDTFNNCKHAYCMYNYGIYMYSVFMSKPLWKLDVVCVCVSVSVCLCLCVCVYVCLCLCLCVAI